MSSLKRFNSRVPWPIRTALVIGAGILLLKGAVALLALSLPVSFKLRGNAPDCPWSRIFTFTSDNSRLAQLNETTLAAVSIKDYDQTFDIQLIASPQRAFWIKRSGSELGGKELLAYLLADHDWVLENNPGNLVRKGDVVLDCGAHVGVFTHLALRLGAAQVVAIEPEPVNVECFRRNFAPEIASGRVVLVSKGVWSAEGTTSLSLALDNSGGNSMVTEKGGSTIQVSVTTIDTLVRILGLLRVDYIKMDIEGAEREALTGALETLRQFRPRLMLDTYHRPDDMKVLPAILRQAHPDYALVCGPCVSDSKHLLPHISFYE